MVVSERYDANVKSTAKAASCAGGRRVIAVIGIDRYDDWPPLSNAVRDATGVAALFGRLGFEEITAPLLDDRATGKAIQSLVTDDLMALGPDDSLVLLYAGHGGTRKHRLGDEMIKTGYLIPVDASRSLDKVATWLRLDAWLHAVSLLPARHILVVLDACHSGIALDPIMKWRDIGSWQDAPLATLQARRSRRIITSALDDQVALDSGPVHGHSLFTGCLLEGLTGGIRGDGGAVTTGSELGLYVQRRVQTYPGARQTPDFGTFAFDDRGEMAIPLAIERALERPEQPALAMSSPAWLDLTDLDDPAELALETESRPSTMTSSAGAEADRLVSGELCPTTPRASGEGAAPASQPEVRADGAALADAEVLGSALAEALGAAADTERTWAVRESCRDLEAQSVAEASTATLRLAAVVGPGSSGHAPAHGARPVDVPVAGRSVTAAAGMTAPVASAVLISRAVRIGRTAAPQHSVPEQAREAARDDLSVTAREGAADVREEPVSKVANRIAEASSPSIRLPSPPVLPPNSAASACARRRAPGAARETVRGWPPPPPEADGADPVAPASDVRPRMAGLAAREAWRPGVCNVARDSREASASDVTQGAGADAGSSPVPSVLALAFDDAAPRGRTSEVTTPLVCVASGSITAPRDAVTAIRSSLLRLSLTGPAVRVAPPSHAGRSLVHGVKEAVLAVGRIGCIAVLVGLLAYLVSDHPLPTAAEGPPAGSVAAPGRGCPEGMVRAPAGTFRMGSSESVGDVDEVPPHAVTMPAYCIDRTEVTVKAYAACIAAKGCSAPPLTVQWGSYSTDDVMRYSRFCNREDRPDHPINCVDWNQAEAYCTWAGKRLPTEAEWEYAARGSDDRAYPWGNEAPSVNRLNACGGECVAMAMRELSQEWARMYEASDRWETTAPVGSFPEGASPSGALDMAGNVWEWTADWYGPYTAAAEDNPRGPEAGTARVLRGGAWTYADAGRVRAASRGADVPWDRFHFVGFRCARGD